MTVSPRLANLVSWDSDWAGLRVAVTIDVPSTSALNLCVVADIPMTTGMGGMPSESLPLMNFCMIVVALLASRPCMPRCASSMIKYNRSLFSRTVFASVCQIV